MNQTPEPGLKAVDESDVAKAMRLVSQALAEGGHIPPGGIRLDGNGGLVVGLPDGTAGTPPTQAARTRALLITHMETLDNHPAVQRAVDRALEAYDRYCEQEGLS